MWPAWLVCNESIDVSLEEAFDGDLGAVTTIVECRASRVPFRVGEFAVRLVP